MRSLHPSLALLSGLLALSSQQECPAAPCDPASCQLPECFCSGERPAVNGTKPQIVYLTFDDALRADASREYYDALFGTPTNHSNSNPNGCAIRASHFITHQSTDYSLVNRWWNYGHEIASHSITHRNNQTYWKTLSEEEWSREIVGERRIAGQLANINPCEISGMRVPFLQVGGDTMADMLTNNNFKYDCSMPTLANGFTNAENAIFPYTLDFQSEQDCPIPPCPVCNHTGLWVQPMIDLEDEWLETNPSNPDLGFPCAMLDACNIIPHGDFTADDPNQVYRLLQKNFKRIYEGEKNDFTGDFVAGSRAPWGLYMHAAWFFGRDWHFQGYKMFIEEIATYPDVWIVPVRSGIAYMESCSLGMCLSNEDLLALGKAEGPFACQDIEDGTGKYAGSPCGEPKACRYENVDIPEDNIHGERMMTVCGGKCPAEYPWLETNSTNPCGGLEPCADCVP